MKVEASKERLKPPDVSDFIPDPYLNEYMTLLQTGTHKIEKEDLKEIKNETRRKIVEKTVFEREVTTFDTSAIKHPEHAKFHGVME